MTTPTNNGTAERYTLTVLNSTCLKKFKEEFKGANKKQIMLHYQCLMEAVRKSGQQAE